MKTVQGGIVYRNNQPETLAAVVDKIEFPTVGKSATVPQGAQGTMYLKNPPPQIGHYDQGNVLNYQDGNHHNDYSLRVLENIGPSKYKI